MSTGWIGLRWACARLTREPALWTAWLLLVLLLRATALLPFGPIPGAWAQLAALGGLSGTVLVLAALPELRALVARVPASQQQLAYAYALVAGSGMGALPALIFHSSSSSTSHNLDWATGASLGLALLHTSALGMLLFALDLGRLARSVALPLMAIALPALLPPEPRGAASAAWLLDVFRPLRSPPAPSGLPSWEALAPMMLCGTAAWWLGTGARHRP